jgi:hypothetical protein
MFLNYKIKQKIEKVGLYTQNGHVNQPDNSDITQLVGIHICYAQVLQK